MAFRRQGSKDVPESSADFTTSGGPVYVSQEFAQYLTTTQVDIDGEPTIRRRRLHF
ncbi:hypothetical protein [Mycobacterium sp.]|uniref:hypothetical protein n=1 Tax=Mycobacterium sp. TaxID=1785 RepID=UPI003F9C9CA9